MQVEFRRADNSLVIGPILRKALSCSLAKLRGLLNNITIGSPRTTRQPPVLQSAVLPGVVGIKSFSSLSIAIASLPNIHPASVTSPRNSQGCLQQKPPKRRFTPSGQPSSSPPPTPCLPSSHPLSTPRSSPCTPSWPSRATPPSRTTLPPRPAGRR